jgi:hypothetical protein
VAALVTRLSPSEFVEQLRLSGIEVHIRTVHHWCKKKTLRALKVGRRWWIDPRELTRMLREDVK